MRDLAVVLVAAGRGERLGAAQPKAFVALAGRPLLAHALANLKTLKRLAQVVVAAPESHLEEAKKLVEQANLDRSVVTVVVAGGETRQQSISNALKKVQDFLDIVLVHDAARALASSELFNRVAEEVDQKECGVVPTLPVADTIKRVSDSQVLDTVNRSNLAIAQTPQGFPLQKLLSAYSQATADYTDDAALFQAWGGTVLQVLGEPDAFKITTPADLAAASRLFVGSQLTGIGTDTHRFTDDPNKTLKLACIEWPGEPALEGHSDGDAVAHAVVDALLSAAGLGDIGSNFGVDRPEFAGAAGEVFVRATVEKLSTSGFHINNVSVQIIANRPKLAPKREQAQARMSELVGAPVTIGATTTDGLGFLGNSEGLAAVATALITGPADRLAS